LAYALIECREFIMMTHVCRGVAALLVMAAAVAERAPVAAAGDSFGPGEPVTLTDAQRAKILRAITADRGASGPSERVINEPSKPASSTQSLPRPTGDLRVGTAAPATVPLTPLPDSVGVEVPAVRRFSYVFSGGRLFLVDPDTNMVLSEINR
jgi:hypothetical protein